VTWNGIPVKSGFVTFIPLDGMAAEAGEIRNGQFEFEARSGNSRVEIQANKESGFNKSMNQPNLVQYLPPEFNTHSTLTKEVSPDGEHIFHFQLEGKDL
jgi:hypothetical protein